MNCLVWTVTDFISLAYLFVSWYFLGGNIIWESLSKLHEGWFHKACLIASLPHSYLWKRNSVTSFAASFNMCEELEDRTHSVSSDVCLPRSFARRHFLQTLSSKHIRNPFNLPQFAPRLMTDFSAAFVMCSLNINYCIFDLSAKQRRTDGQKNTANRQRLTRVYQIPTGRLIILSTECQQYLTN